MTLVQDTRVPLAGAFAVRFVGIGAVVFLPAGVLGPRRLEWRVGIVGTGVVRPSDHQILAMLSTGTGITATARRINLEEERTLVISTSGFVKA